MTRLGEEIKRLKESRTARLVEAGKELTAVVRVIADELCDLFERALDTDKINDESDLAKVTALKQPILLCTIGHDGAMLRVDLDRYNNGQFKQFNDIQRGMVLDIATALIQEKYPEYKVSRNGGDICIAEPPPPPMSFIQWVRSLFKPRELI
ncbi:hypothetical protein pEaSNUABM37_00078 [Erwinia phage pEa_SNUABM_37]|nr:hypothetical protein pEaSNUABM37_00078 [Erwinia phage pEa_SNUABM_37]QXO10548.1 hypothetical protein pEaSNUABM48_00078 [Erwinia phage pEa_SNUABM_48]